ncbi:MAG: 50S ribosomal protein L21 [Elusimicrobiales bacterium]|jgi:large subunit ribosomal protein L21|nr:50S ribosomal protein L21 [Elusimicrobiales bacterium]HOL62772.1 50S ribosomal protein L21 [Elusimicrobiales bacterium]HPO94845.1 50S ribosomal protein L21 [Elusimicrobiales bacterium]
MYAIIKTGGKQYWVTPGEVLQVEKLNAKVGEDVEIKALWSSGENESSASNKGKVIATVVRHIKSPKVIVFKRRPKKAYEKSKGHRQVLTEIKVKDIQLS